MLIHPPVKLHTPPYQILPLYGYLVLVVSVETEYDSVCHIEGTSLRSFSIKVLTYPLKLICLILPRSSSCSIINKGIATFICLVTEFPLFFGLPGFFICNYTNIILNTKLFLKIFDNTKTIPTFDL